MVIPLNTEIAGSSIHLSIMRASKCISDDDTTVTLLCPGGRERAITLNCPQTCNIRKEALAACEFGCCNRNTKHQWLWHNRRLFFFHLAAWAHLGSPWSSGPTFFLSYCSTIPECRPCSREPSCSRPSLCPVGLLSSPNQSPMQTIPYMTFPLTECLRGFCPLDWMPTGTAWDLKMVRTAERGMGKGVPQTQPLRHTSRRETGHRALGSQGLDPGVGNVLPVQLTSRSFELGKAAEFQPRWRLHQWALSRGSQLKWTQGWWARLSWGEEEGEGG